MEDDKKRWWCVSCKNSPANLINLIDIPGTAFHSVYSGMRNFYAIYIFASKIDVQKFYSNLYDLNEKKRSIDLMDLNKVEEQEVFSYPSSCIKLGHIIGHNKIKKYLDKFN